MDLVYRYDFLKLPIEERRRILNQQIETMNAHYQDDTEWQDWVNIGIDIDNGEVYDEES